MAPSWNTDTVQIRELLGSNVTPDHRTIERMAEEIDDLRLQQKLAKRYLEQAIIRDVNSILNSHVRAALKELGGHA